MSNLLLQHPLNIFAVYSSSSLEFVHYCEHRDDDNMATGTSQPPYYHVPGEEL